VIDAVGYLGAAATGFGTGWLVQHWGWRYAFIMWGAGAALGAAVIALLGRHSATAEEAP